MRIRLIILLLFPFLLLPLNSPAGKKTRKLSPYIIKKKTEKSVYKLFTSTETLKAKKRRRKKKRKGKKKSSPYIIRSKQLLTPHIFRKKKVGTEKKRKSKYKFKKKNPAPVYILSPDGKPLIKATKKKRAKKKKRKKK